MTMGYGDDIRKSLDEFNTAPNLKEDKEFMKALLDDKKIEKPEHLNKIARILDIIEKTK